MPNAPVVGETAPRNLVARGHVLVHVHRFVASTFFALATLLASASEGTDRACPRAARPFPTSDTTLPCWTGPDGARLPFDAFEEVEEFLDTARVVEVREIGEGRSKPKKLLLERDGVRAHAVATSTSRGAIGGSTTGAVRG